MKKIKIPAFTLIEMLIVMTMMIAILAIGISSFTGLRSTIIMNESTNTLEQDIRTAQRAALLLKREGDERWLYGVGVDFADIKNSGQYRIFKWCSPYNEYGPTRTNSAYPNYDPSFDSGNVGPTNGNFPATVSDIYREDCDYGEGNIGQPVGYLLEANDIIEFTGRIGAKIDEPLIVGSSVSDDTRAYYVLFESVSGNTFFYDKEGLLLNHSGGSSQDLELAIATPDKDRGLGVTIRHNSGKVTVSKLTAEQIASYDFGGPGFEIEESGTTGGEGEESGTGTGTGTGTVEEK